MNQPRAIVLGMGSIGRRHARLLAEMSIPLAAVSAYPQEGIPTYDDLNQAVPDFEPTHVVVANPTSMHLGSIEWLARLGFTGKMLVEKPLFDGLGSPSGVDRTQIQVAYNLRFHPLLQKLKKRLQGRRVLTVQAYVGQYLPTWRPERPYQESYSSKRMMGGGALRDLSHELDYLNWLFGPWVALSALGGKISDLEIDSDDHFCLLYQTTKDVRVGLEVNYLDRRTSRRLNVNCADTSFYLDFISGTLSEGDQVEQVTLERDQMYKEQLRCFLGQNPGDACDYLQAMEVIETFAAAEAASRPPFRWITRNLESDL
ncbi:MAG: gfo/Idh/MocA family oxidoreductase [bacterium]|nr:gfo/Idh/MocA family oxidoreductase [bacterium]